ncbi:MAG: hypothetical protein NTV79_02465 [Candidatus Aureabacteria bacterium]|nr:hypothetical protein [Candidatus Auribacterota bacterium]
MPSKAARPRPPASHRLDIYIIDSGWGSTAHRVLAKNLDIIQSYMVPGDNLFILSPPQSIEFLKSHPGLIRRDPLVVMIDRLAEKLKNTSGYGIRLSLGGIHRVSHIETAIKALLQLINNRRKMPDLCLAVREHLHKADIKGAVEIIMEEFGAEHASEESA